MYTKIHYNNRAYSILIVPNHLHFGKDSDLECFDVELNTNDAGNEWSFGNCFSSQEYAGIGFYTERCCILPQPHILSCMSAERNGWGRSFISIYGHHFCDDHVGYKAMRQIDLSGMYKFYWQSIPSTPTIMNSL